MYEVKGGHTSGGNEVFLRGVRLVCLFKKKK